MLTEIYKQLTDEIDSYRIIFCCGIKQYSDFQFEIKLIFNRSFMIYFIYDIICFSQNLQRLNCYSTRIINIVDILDITLIF